MSTDLATRVQEQEDELHFLRWFWCECDFGPAHSDVIRSYKEYYTQSKGKPLPLGYRPQEDE